MDWAELNLSVICRCCKRPESGMTSIFDGTTHPTNPSVKEMLSNIANLNVQEDDGLPSLVCTSCLNNIHGAYTFILQLILIDAELSQILARRKEAKLDSLPQSTHTHTGNESFGDGNMSIVKHEDIEVSEAIVDIGIDEDNQEYIEDDSSSVVDSSEGASMLVKTEMFNEADELETEEICPRLEKKRQKTSAVFNCKLCEYTSTRMFNLKQHLHRHCKDKPFACLKCTRSFARRDQMLRHCRKCDGEERPICDLCNYTFRAEETLRYHKEIVHSAKGGKDSLQMISLTLEELQDSEKLKRYYTVGDKIAQNNDDVLKVHRPSVKVEGVRLKLVSKRRKPTAKSYIDYNCKMCDYSSSRMYNLKQHLLHAHCKEKPFACSKCTRTFARRDQMLRHWRKCNGEEKQLCNICHYCFRNEEALRRHKATVHSNEGMDSSKVISLTLQDMKDPEEMKKYYTVTDVQVDDN